MFHRLIVKQKKIRVGRGIGSGKGKTSGRGVKGQKSRSGVAIKSFEGGQMPLARRLPRRGFTNIFKEKYQIVNLGDIINLKDGSVIDPVFLKDSGLIRSSLKPVKILGNGLIEKKIKISASAFSMAAKEKIEKAGGEIIILWSIKLRQFLVFLN